MRCERCDKGNRRPVQRAKLAEREGSVAVVLGVPMHECPACGERWLDWEVARRLGGMLDAMLAGDVEVVTRHYHETDLPAA
jgi:YgiT-type zinc finger domain-containing protein